MLMAEALAVPGIGLFFAGLAALATGSLVLAGIIGSDAYAIQTAIFLGGSAAFAAILWKPLQRCRQSASAKPYRNMVGDIATVADAPLTKQKTGTVTWSGTRMQAILAPESTVDSLDPGSIVEITEISGNRLIVTPPPEQPAQQEDL